MQLKLWYTGGAILMLLHFSDFLFSLSNCWRITEKSFLGKGDERSLHGWMLTSQVPGKTMSMLMVPVSSFSGFLQFWAQLGLFFSDCLSVCHLNSHCSGVLYYVAGFLPTHDCFLDIVSLRFNVYGMGRH